MTQAAGREWDGAAHDQRFRLGAVDWPSYRAIADALRGRHVRVTYDRGTLELMTISRWHAQLSRLLGRLVFVLAEEAGKPLSSAGDMTCEREDLQRAVEPDECFYIDGEPKIRGKVEIDLSVDPPPDLAIEVEVSRSAASRLPIYAALGVPEVWRYDGRTLQVLHLAPAEGYEPADHSRYFPSVKIAAIVGALARRDELDEVALVNAFRSAVRSGRTA